MSPTTNTKEGKDKYLLTQNITLHTYCNIYWPFSVGHFFSLLFFSLFCCFLFVFFFFEWKLLICHELHKNCSIFVAKNKKIKQGYKDERGLRDLVRRDLEDIDERQMTLRIQPYIFRFSLRVSTNTEADE